MCLDCQMHSRPKRFYKLTHIEQFPTHLSYKKFPCSICYFSVNCNFDFQGFALWLNKGSTLRIRWEAQTSCLGQLEVSIIKGKSQLLIIFCFFTFTSCLLKNQFSNSFFFLGKICLILDLSTISIHFFDRGTKSRDIDTYFNESP